MRHALVTETGDHGGMTPIRRALVRLVPLVLGLSVAACGATTGAADLPRPTDPTTAPTAAPAASSAASGAPSIEPDATASAAPTVALDQPWATAELVDVANGETFRIADLAGRTVIIETMAIWCTNCKAQQGHVYEALAELGSDDVEYLLIDVDPNESADALADYREANGFTGTYVVADTDLARALAAEFGDQVLNPPSTPMIVIGSDGRVTLTPYGDQKSPDEVVALAVEHGA